MVAEDIFSVTDGNASFLRAARAGNLEKVLEYLKGSIDINTSNANGLNALHLASKEGHVTVLNELLKRGANVNAATKKGNTSLHIASLAGQEEIVKILVRNGANVNVQSQNGFTPLYMAAQENHDKVVRYLLANGANQSLATEDGFTPLAVALQQGHDKVVAVLLENDTKGRVRLPALHIAAKKDDCKAAALLLQNDHDPDVTSKSGFTPLHIAAHYGNENIAHLLLEKSADVNFAAKHQITPLHVASKWGKTNMVTLLIENNGKIDASTRDGLTPLHCAARSGHDQVVDLLLEKGAPITAKTKNGLAPLHMAAQGDHVDSARILLYHKAPVDDVTVDYLTALHVAAHCGHVRVAKLLLDRKADPNARALNGFTPLHIACKKNRIKVVELLLKHGASIEATTESGLTPLHVASFMGCMNIVIFLIQHGANPDVPTVRGETPLHLAARANQADIIRILLRNGAHVDACAREQQTPLHIAARLGNVDIVGLLLQHGAAVDATTKDMYTALHIAAKEGQEEVASVLLDHGASLTATNKKGFTPLHLAAKYGNIKVARLLLQKDAPVDAQGKNGVTPLHVAAHYDHVNVALLLLDKGASPHATAKNGYTPLHIAAKKNQMDIATTLLEYGAKPNAESKAGFTPLHLAAQEGHTDMTTLLIEHHADVNSSAKNGLTPLHLCAQEDRVNVAAILVKNGAEIGPQTKAGYTPLHVACHFGQINMVRFLLQHGADVNAITSHGYTPLHQAAQQGHTLIINLLLENNASPNHTTNQGQTALSIAQRLGYISVVETLKVVTETIVTTTTTTVTEEKYKVVAPEIMQETFMSDSEDEGGDDFEDSALFGKPTHATHVYLPYYEGQKMQMSDDANLGDQTFHYLTVDEIQSLGDDSLPIDVTRDEKGIDSMIIGKDSKAPLIVEEDQISPAHVAHLETVFAGSYVPDNVDIAKAPVHAGKLKWKTFLVSFMVDARGGAMRGCRHSGVRVIIPPRKAPMPMRITCRYLRREKLAHPPPLMEGEACASRILEVGPASAKFLGPVIIEIPHFASLRGREREITILRSDNGETWREHTLEATEDAVHDVLNESFEGEELSALEDLNTNRITRILTTDFPQYFAIITRIRQEVHAIGPEGGMVSSTVVPQVQAIFPEGALTKKIKVGLQAQPMPPELVAKLLGNRVAVSPIVTVEPRRRKFHKPITLTIPVPQAATKGMINQYSGDAPTLRLLCSITGGTTKAQWEDVTGSTPLTFVNDCVSFTTTVSARFWLMDCRQVNEATRFATELYKEAIHVPFMAKFVVFAKRYDPMEAHLRVFCMTDDKEDKTLESQEHFVEVAKSRDVEVLEGKCQYLEFAGNLIPVTKSGEQLFLAFQAFRENRLPFLIRVKDTHQEPMGRLAFMREPRVGRGEPPQSPICNLNIALPDVCKVDSTMVNELVTVEKKYGFIEESGLSKPELIHRADLRLSDIAKQLKDDWVPLALQLDVPESDINTIKSEHSDVNQQAIVMLRLWMQKAGNKANGNTLEKALRKINREDIISNCMFNVELVTDDVEKAVAKVHLDQSGFDAFKEELGPSRDASLRRETSLEISYDEQDLMKEAESAAETSSESGSVCEKDLHTKEGKKLPSPIEVIKQDSLIEDVTKKDKEQPEVKVEPVIVDSSKSLTETVSKEVEISKISEITSKEVSEKSPEEISIKVSEDIAKTVEEPEEISSEISEEVLEKICREVPEKASDEIFEKVKEISERTYEEGPTLLSSEKIPEDLSKKISNEISEELFEKISRGIPEKDAEESVKKTEVFEKISHISPSKDISEEAYEEIQEEIFKKVIKHEPEKVSEEVFKKLSDDNLSDKLSDYSSSQIIIKDEKDVQDKTSPEHMKEETVTKLVITKTVTDGDLLEDLQQAFQDINVLQSSDEGQVLNIKETKTPPPSPAEKNAKGEQETSVQEKKEVLEDGTIKHVVTTVTKTTIVQDGEELQLDRDQIAKLVESETWPSGEMDTSQVSVSSLPEDEKSEPTTATMSSGTTAEQDISSADGDKPQIETRVEEKEWTETDESGGVMHVICKKTTITKEPEEIIITKGKVDAEAVSLPGETSVQHPGEEDMELTVDENNISEKPADEKEESLSFAEKRNFFQRLSMTNDVPVSTSTVVKTSKETIQTEFQKTGEVIEEQISFSEKLKMFQAEKEDVKKQSPEKVKDENEQKLFELDKEELTESEIAAVEYLESKNIMTEQEVEESSGKKDISIKETTSLEAVEQEVASMLAEVDRQSKELLGHVVGLLPEGDQHSTKLDISETEKETDGKYVPLDLHYAVEKDISSTEFQFEVSGRDLDESLVSECKPKQLESIETESHLKANETAISHPPPPDAFATTTPFWPPQSPSKVRDESFMPEQQTAAGKTTTEDSVLPSPSKDSPIQAKTVGLDESSHSVLLPSFGMDDEKSSSNEIKAKITSEQVHDSEFISKSSSESVFKDSAQKDELHIDDSKLADEDDDDDINLFKDKDEYEMTVNLSVKVQQQIKSQILNEELDQSIEENPPEEKVLGISNIPDFDHEEKVAQQIRTTILSQELEADIESASPEQKEFPVHSAAVESGFNIETLKTSDYLLQNALQQETEQITWETPIQEETETVLHEEVKEIPREKQLIVEHDEEVISEGDDAMKDTQNSDSICPTSESSISEKDKFKPSSLEQVSSEISDEDLVERDHSSSELETKPINILKEEMDLMKKELLEEKTKKELTSEDLYKSSETQLQDETPTDKKSDILESDQMKTEHESHTDSYTSESSDYTHRETEVNSSGAISEDSHYKDRQDSSEISDRESSQPLFVTAETLYTTDGREDKRSDSEPSDGVKDPSNIVLRQKSASKKDKQGGQEMESWSSSGETESHYYSFETSESGKTPRDTPAISRPCSSEFEVTIVSGQPSSEYETCVTSQETSIGVSESYTTAVTSQETSYSTACSSLSHSSRESAYSVDSESSGHLASLELSSETSETLVPSAQEIEMDLVQEIDTPVLEEEIAAQAGFKEPYDSEIPECIIREGVEVPFLKDWSLQANESDISSAKEWIWPCERDIQMVMSPFEIITNDDLAECLQDQAAQEPLSDSDKGLYDVQSKETIQIDSLETKSEKSVEEEKLISEMQNDKAESEKYLLCSESSELPSQSIEAIDKLEVGTALSDDVAEQLSHDELSISESSATQSEQTWQTSSIETAIHISQQMSSCFKPYTETPPVTRVDSTVSDVTLDLSGSPIHSAIVQDNLQSAQEPSIYHQLNGPVEVEYIPEYDAPFDDSRENISVQNVQETQIQNYDAEGQYMQISDDQADFNSERCLFLDSEEMVTSSQPPVEFSEQWISDGEVQAQAREDSLSLLTEDLWQQHVHRHESEIEKIPDIQHDDIGETNCLPESEQNVLHSQGFVHINSEMVKDYEIEKPKLESRDSFDMTDKAEAIDTSPEDERYDNLLHDLDEQICDDDSIKDKTSESFQKLSTDSIQDQREPADKNGLLVTKETLYESQNTYLYNMGFEKELPEEVLDVAEDQFTEEKDKLQDSYQETEFVDGVYERGQEYDDVSLGYGELYTHQEEDEETEDAERDERHYSPAAVSIDESKRSTPSYDTLGVRKFFGRSGEHDDMSVSSLQEFERLEAEIAMGSRMSQGSGDSNERHSVTKSGEHDDVSMNSLIEFEKLETECIEVEHSESVPVVEKLSEIEEGHESLSEASQGTLSDHAAEHEESEDSDDYDKRMCEIDEIIRQAQSNVEKFDDSSAVLSSEKSPAKHVHTVSSDSTESSLVDKSPSPKKYQGSLKETERTQILLDTQLPISLEREQAEHELESPATLARHIIIGRTISGHSVESGESLPRSSTSTVTQYDTESLKDREIDVEEIDIGCEDKKISPSEEEKYFIQETDQDSFQTEWNLHDLAEHGSDQIKQTCDTEFHSIPNIDHLKQLQPVEFRLQDDITKETFDIQWQEEESHLSTENLTGEGESIKAETTGSGHSSSNGRDGEHDMSGKGDCMVSGTDSIDPSSSTATHATYQFETDSVMSSSINSAQASGEEFTMISSTDTLEAETKVTHVNELAFEEIPEAPHAEEEILLGGDKAESMSVEQSVTIQIGTEEYESLPQEVKDKVNKMLAASEVDPEISEFPASDTSFCESGVVTIRKIVKTQITSEQQVEKTEFPIQKDITLDSTFQSEIKEKEGEEKQPIPSHSSISSEMFHDDLQTFNKNTSSMPEGTDSSLNYPCSPVTSAVPQTVSSDYDIDEPSTLHKDTDESTAVSHGIGPATGNVIETEDSNEDGLSDGNECTVKTRIVTKTTITTSDGQEISETSEQDGSDNTLRDSMQQILDNFMTEENQQLWEKKQEKE